MTLDNSDNQIPIDAAEVSITRRLFRSGDSEYEINGARARLRDIHDILVKAGLAQRSYTVIGQGQADEIVRARPAERKEYFEEAAGIKQFQNKKDQTLRRLEITRRNLLRVEDLVREIKPRLASLKRQADRAAKREEIEKKWRTLSLQWFGAQIANLNDEVKNKLRQLREITAKRQELESKIKGLEKKNDPLEQTDLEKQRELLVDRLKRGRQALTELENEQATLKRKKASLEEKGLTGDLTKLPGELAEKETALSGAAKQLKSLAPQIESLQKSITAAEQESLKAGTRINHLRQQLKKARPTRSLDQKEIAKIVVDLQSSLDGLFEQIKELKNLEQLPNLVRLADQPRQQLDLLKSKVERGLPIDTVKLNNDLDQIMESRDGLLATLARHRARLAELSTEYKFIKKQSDTLKREIQEINSKLSGAEKGGARGATKANLEHFDNELKKISQKIAVSEEQVQALEAEERELDHEFDQSLAKEKANEKLTRQLRDQLTQIIESETKLNVIKGQHDVRLEDLINQAKQTLGEDAAKSLIRGNAPAMNADERAELKNQIERASKKMELAGGVDQETLQEYKDTDKRFNFLSTQSQDLKEASDKLRQIVHELDQKIQSRFNKAILSINKEFDKAFKILFDGGSAKLIVLRAKKKTTNTIADQLEDDQMIQGNGIDQGGIKHAVDARGHKTGKSDQKNGLPNPEPLDQVTAEVEALRNSQGIAGIEIKATPPGKKLQGVSMLSGGEKALTSIALLSAILATKPSPFVVLDEVDAALDEANSRRFAKIINSLSKKTQFITITHNRETMRKADILYGVTMQRDGISKLLSVKLDDVNNNKVLTNV